MEDGLSVWRKLCTADALAAYTRNGAARRAYVFTQSRTALTLRLAVPAHTAARDVHVSVQRDTLRVRLDGERFDRLNARLAAPVLCDADADDDVKACWHLSVRARPAGRSGESRANTRASVCVCVRVRVTCG